MKKSFTRLRINTIQKTLLVFLALNSLSHLSAQQVTIFSNGFESGAPEWTTESIAGENAWVLGECAGNGTSFAGVASAYISTGNVVGCGEEFAYTNSASGVQSIVFYREVDAFCGSDLTFSFDYQISGDVNDFGEVVYSTNGGSTWILVPGGTLGTTAGWDTQSIGLPASLENTTFHLGFRFTYDDATITAPPLAIDNVILQVTDTQNPILTCPVSDTLFTNALSCSSDIDDLSKRLITISDNCTDSVNITFIQTPDFTHTLSGHLDNVNVELEAFDEAGNTSSCIINVVLIDAIAPVYICPPNATVFVDNQCDYEIEDFTSLISPTDNCTAAMNITISQSPLPGVILSGDGTTQQITLIASDEAGNENTCFFTLTLDDNIAPSIICPGDQTAYADGGCQAVMDDYRSLAVVDDNCTDNLDLIIMQSPTVGLFFNSDEVVTLTVTDENGNSDNCQFNVMFIDTISPSIVCPTDQTVSADVNCESILLDYTGSLVVGDNCTSVGDLVINQLPSAGSTITGAINTITLTVFDEAGNDNSCVFNVEVEDNTLPTIDCPTDMTVSTDINCQFTLDDYSSLVTIDDNCSDVSNLILTQLPATGTIITGDGTVQLITMEVEDEAGNLANCTFNITLIDDLAPEIICGGTLNASVDASCEYILTDYTNHGIATDNCTAQGVIIKTQTPIVGTTLGLGSHVIEIFAEDEASNISSCTFTLNVIDNIDPNINACAPNTSINADPEFCNGVLGNYTALVNADDNCTASFDLTIAQSPVPGTIINSNQTVTMTVTDISGNSSVCVFNVAIIDNTPPEVDCPATVTATIISNCDYTIPNLVSVTTGTDNCSTSGDLVFNQVPAAGSFSSGITNVTVTLTDEGGNSGNCIVAVHPEDLTPPTITCPSDDVINVGTNCNTLLSDYTGSAIASDNCPGLTLTQFPSAGENLITGNHTIMIEAEDGSGNISSCTFNLFVEEDELPEITCPAPINTCDPVVNYTEPVGTDNCIAYTYQTDVTGLTTGDTFPIGITTLSYEVADSSGNIASCSFNIEVLEYPDLAIVEDDIQLCDTVSTIISANNPTTGTGEWSIFSGTGTLNNQFASTTGINNLSIGENQIIWTISTPSCGNTTDTLTITVYDLPLPASTLDTVYACDLEFVQISANVPSAGVGVWYDVNGNTTFSNPNGVPTAVFNLQEGWNQIVWSISNGSCPVSEDTTNIYTTEIAQIIQPSEDSLTYCLGNTNMNLVGTEPQPGTLPRWYFPQGYGFLATPFNHETTVSDIEFGENILVYELKKQQCPATRDTLFITVNTCGEYGDFPNMITPNGDGQNDVWVLDNLSIIHPECIVRIFNRWGNLVFESEGYKDSWNGTHKGERLPMGTYYYTIDLNDTEKTVLKGNVSIIY